MTTRYSTLSIIQKINFKSFCVNQRLSIYGKDGFTPRWFIKTVDGIYMDGSRLYDYMYNRSYSISFK